MGEREAGVSPYLRPPSTGENIELITNASLGREKKNSLPILGYFGGSGVE